ncbi:alpha-hydroxy acid oxidase [Thiomicrorhabdus indica]|uniref:alpha-hydroxy acid oxidase n=1 Tax=Thiomicrorhabdus indica TaxID=2267253 RepID=UPI00102DB25A|nr:alpha-hydroxy acid oxidase [Thiomicrorhabdus indica]
MFDDYQELQRHVLCAQDFEALAQTKLDEALFAYISGGSGQEITLQRNRTAFEQTTIMPNSLEDVSQGHCQWSYQDHTFSAPILLAPVAQQAMVHELGEVASAQAAEAINQGIVLSTLSSYDLETISENSSGWKAFQLYAQPELNDSLDLIQRAKDSGYQAIVITIDTPIQQVSLKAKHLGFQLPTSVPNNLKPYRPVELANLSEKDSYVFQGIMSQALNWQSLEQLITYCQQLELPVWIKGVINPQQALRLKQLGADGLIVSNHGGRALEGIPSSIEVLPQIRQAVGSEMTLLLDSGIRSGQDIFKALAIGADAVLIGRLQLYALAVGGAMGIVHLLKLLTEELQMTMALCGCETLQAISSRQLWETQQCFK